jgi:L-lactate utilization protein LutB
MMLAKHQEKTNFSKNFQMNTSAQQTSVAESYFESLRNLSADTKLDLISKLSQSLKKEDVKPVNSLESLFGAYVSDETADEIIADIRASRLFTHNIEPL